MIITISVICILVMSLMGKVSNKANFIEDHFYGPYKPGRSDKIGFKPY